MELYHEMTNSINLWIDELQQEFKLNETEAWQTANTLKFYFNRSTTLSLSSYLTKKVNLLHAASIMDPHTIKRLLWEGLEPGLALITLLWPGESLDAFRKRVRDNEPAARRAWSEKR